MKNYLITLLLLVCAVTLTGCGAKNEEEKASGELNIGSKKITCTKSSVEEGIPTDIKIVATFKGKEFTYFAATNKMTFETEELAKTTYTYMGMAKTTLDGLGFKVTINQNDKNITIDYEGDVGEIAKKAEEIQSKDFDYTEETTYTDFKTEMASDGYICK